MGLPNRSPEDYKQLQDRCEALLRGLHDLPVPKGQELWAPGGSFAHRTTDLFNLFVKVAAGNNTELSLGGIKHGFNIMGRGLDSCQRAYIRYQGGAPEAAPTRELAQSLKHPHTLKFFVKLSAMPDDVAMTYESALGLSLPPTRVDGRQFIFQPADGSVQPNPLLIEDVDAWREQSEAQEAWGCPVRRLIPGMWRDVVDHCLTGVPAQAS